jgi:hypothetical protein
MRYSYSTCFKPRFSSGEGEGFNYFTEKAKYLSNCDIFMQIVNKYSKRVE